MKRPERIFLITGATCSVLLLGAMAFDVRLNFTDSAPRGLWTVETIDRLSIKRGSLVSICPPDRPIVRAVADLGGLPAGDCPILGVAPLLKPVGAVPGDVIRLYKGRSVTVNGITLPNTVSKDSLPAFPDGEYTVAPGQVWLFSNYNANSFDSRYFGPVPIGNMRGLAAPLLTSGDL